MNTTTPVDTLVFATKALEITPDLTPEHLEKHANGYVRYNNIRDLVHSGPKGIEWFLERVRKLLLLSYPKLPKHALKIYYYTVFCRSESEPESKAFPVYDFLKFWMPNNTISGYGIMFSSQMREYYRDKLENDHDASCIPIDQAVFRSIFTRETPTLGVLQTYPIIMIPRFSGDKPSVTDQYFQNLGFMSSLMTPKGCKFPFRYYHKVNLMAVGITTLTITSAIGQAMFEIVRPNLYPTDDDRRPTFNMDHLLNVRWDQHNGAKKWVLEHAEAVRQLLFLQGIPYPPELMEA